MDHQWNVSIFGGVPRALLKRKSVSASHTSGSRNYFYSQIIILLQIHGWLQDSGENKLFLPEEFVLMSQLGWFHGDSR